MIYSCPEKCLSSSIVARTVPNMKPLVLPRTAAVIIYLLLALSQYPGFGQNNAELAHVYSALDGQWQGTFIVFTDRQGQQPGQAQPKPLTRRILDALDLQETFSIAVKQNYRSLSPWKQEVTIVDTYLQEDGSEKEVSSSGWNLVEEDKMLCIVHKPDETVRHEGHLEDEHTIIWQRSERAPLKIEYFRETVLQDSYTIIGWGYYGDDDPALTPRTWFLGEYRRVR